MWFRFLILGIIFCLLILLQNSYLAHFGNPNFIFILVCALAFCERSGYYLFIIFAVLAGILLDIFSASYFGVSTILMPSFYILVKQARGFFREISYKHSLFYFSAVFAVFYILYTIIVKSVLVISGQPGISFISWPVAANILINLVFAVIVFYLLKISRLAKYV